MHLAALLLQRCYRGLDLDLSEAGRDVLWAVPVESLHLDDEATLDLGPVILVFQLGQLAGFMLVDDPHPAQHFQPRAPGVVHKKQGDPIVVAEIAGGYVLAIAGVVGEADGAVVQHFHESGGATTVLQVGPAGLADAGHVETVAGPKKGHLPLAQAVIGVLASVVGAFYYLRVIKIMWFDEPADEFVPMAGELRLVLGVSGAFTLLFLVIAGPISRATSAAAGTFF